MRNMPAASPQIGHQLKKHLRELGAQIRVHRKKLGISAVATAESAGMSRVTLYRIERGEASVTMGAYLSVVFALGLKLELNELNKKKQLIRKKLAHKILISKYPQLKRLAWQIKENKEISPKEALELYERNWKYVDLEVLKPEERELIQQLLEHFGRERLLV